MAEPRTIVVTGATGRQGGAVIKALQAREPGAWKIVAVTRDVAQPAAKALAATGVVLAQADLLKRDTLDAVLAAHAPVHAFFLVTNPFVARWTGKEAPSGKQQDEVAQGTTAVDAAKAAGVRHFVFTSVASADDCIVDGEEVEIFAAKHRAEKYLQASGLPHSIVAPSGFFDNMLSSFAGIKQGVVPGLLKKGVRTQMIASADIGVFVALLLHEGPLGQRLEIAGEDTDAWRQADTLARLRNEPDQWKVSVPPDWVFKVFIPKPVRRLRDFLAKKGTKVDVEACRRLHPQLMTFEDWCRAEGLDKRQLDAPSRCVVM